MPVVVEVKPRAEFDAWLAEQKAATQAAAEPATRVAMNDESTAATTAAAE